MIPSEKYAQIDQLAEDFAARLRRGERPSYQEYIDLHPELAVEIRELFPALVEMEHVDVSPDILGSADLPLRQVGDFRIIREVGRGGMGVVYEAEQQSLGRRVALKIMPRRLSRDRSTIERFKREARTAAQLHHTNIVPVFEVGEDRDTCYYAMQFIQGQGLDQVIVELCRLRSSAAGETNRPAKTAIQSADEEQATGRLANSMLTGQFAVAPTLPLDESTAVVVESTHAAADATTYSAALPGQTDRSSVQTSHGHYFRSVARIGDQAAAALSYAHERGIIHRDIKPSNLLLDTAGTVWITDFGLAKTDDDGLTKTGDVLGTFRYMAPERFSGLGDARGDIFSLGLTLYELLLLRPAFDSPDRLRLIEQVKQCQIERPRSIDARIPRDLETIVLKAIDWEPKRRYQSAQQLSDDLRRFLAGEPIAARRTGELERLRLWCRRNPIVATMTGAVAVLLLVLAIGAILSAFWLRDQRDLAVANETRAVKAEGTASAAKQEALAKLWDSSLVAARAGRMSHSPGQRFGSLRAIQQALGIPLPLGRSKDELRTEAIACLLLPDLEVSKEWPGWPAGSRGFAIDSAFQRYARGDASGNISVRRIADDGELFVLPGSSPVPDTYDVLAFSTDGHFLSQMSEDGHQRIWRIDVEPPAIVVAADYTAYAFSPDSRQVALAIDDKLRFYDLPSGRESKHMSIGIKPYRLDWNPRRSVMAVCDHTNVLLIDTETGAMQWHLPVASGTSWCAWHPDGRILAIAIGDFDAFPKITIWDMVTRKQLLPPLEGLKSRGVFVRFDQSGDRLMTTDWSHVWRLWDARTGRQLLSEPAGGNGICLSADNGSAGLDAIGRSLRVYRYASGSELCMLVHRGPAAAVGFNSVECCRLDADGRLLAVRAGSGIAAVDVVRGEELASLTLPDSSPFAQDNSGALLTHGPTGLLRWPASTDGKRIRSFGPPEKLWSTMCGTGQAPGAGADGRMWAFPKMNVGAVALSLPEGREITLAPQADVRFAAVSPDGLWIATGSHNVLNGPGAKVWDARTGRHLRDLPVGEYCTVAFSQAGKWLSTTGGGTRIWSVGTWQASPAASDIAGIAAFTDDDSLVAMEGAPGTVRLVAPATGRELATLTAPETERLSPMCFTHDGSRLVCRGMESESLYIFDLGRIREDLGPLRLDWDGPSIATTKHQRPEAIDVRFVDKGTPAAIRLNESQIDKQLLAVVLDPFDAAKRLELGIQLIDSGDLENGDLEMRLALALRGDLPEAHAYRSRMALLACGTWHVRHERWKRAAADYVLLADIQSNESETGLQAATLLLMAGDRAGYREFCRRILERFGNTTNPNDAERTAKACLISDGLKDELPEAARLAEFAARKGAESGDHLWFELTAGMAEYREGLYSAAARRLERNHESTHGIAVLDELTCLFEAMALIKTSRTDEARRLIETAAPAVNSRFGHSADDFGFNWHDWLLARIALEEAQQMHVNVSQPAK